MGAAGLTLGGAHARNPGMRERAGTRHGKRPTEPGMATMLWPPRCRRFAARRLGVWIALAAAHGAWAAQPATADAVPAPPVPVSRSATAPPAIRVRLDAAPRSGREAAEHVAAAAGLRIENPQALDGLPTIPRPQDGEPARTALSRIGREARLRAVYAGDTVRYVPGDHHFALARGSGAGALMDAFALEMPAQGVLEGLAGATGYGLVVDPALETSKPVTLDLLGIPLQTILTILGKELRADIRYAGGRIVARPAAPDAPPRR